MYKFTNMISRWMTGKDEWVYLMLFWAFSFDLVETNLWRDFFYLFGCFCLAYSPILLFSTFHRRDKKPRTEQQWLLYRRIVVIGYPCLLIAIKLLLPSVHPLFDWMLHYSPAVLVVAILLEFCQKKDALPKIQNNKSRQFGLNQGIFLFVLLWCFWAAYINHVSWQHAHGYNAIFRDGFVLIDIANYFAFYIQFFVMYFACFLVFAFQRHILSQRVLNNRGAVSYILGLVLSIFLFTPLLTQLLMWLPLNVSGGALTPLQIDNPFAKDLLNSIIGLTMIATPIILINQSQRNKQQILALEKVQVDTELALLKQQVNPHFLFNTLNNLYVLCRKKSDQAPEVVMQLADLMRYVIYQGNKPTVPMIDEAKYIEDYIRLQSIRLHKSLALQIDIDIKDKQAQIEPLLLIMLVENAFKHGIEPATQSCYLSVTLKADEHKLIFICENSVESASVAPKITEQENADGVGLKNLKNRLALQCPDRHQLTITQEPQRFHAKLEITLV